MGVQGWEEKPRPFSINTDAVHHMHHPHAGMAQFPDVHTPRKKAPSEKPPLSQGKATPQGHEFSLDETALEIDESIAVIPSSTS